MRRIVGIIVLTTTLAGCGDVEWFPNQPTTAQTTTTTQQQTDTPGTTTVKDSTSTVSASNLLSTEISRSATSVNMSFKADITNSGSSATAATVWIAGKDANGFELDTFYVDDPSVSAGESKTLTKAWSVELSVFNRVSTWQIISVKKL